MEPTQKTREKRDNASEMNDNFSLLWNWKSYERSRDLDRSKNSWKIEYCPQYGICESNAGKKRIQNSERSKPELRIYSKISSSRKILFEIYRVSPIYSPSSHKQVVWTNCKSKSPSSLCKYRTCEIWDRDGWERERE